MNNTQVQSGVFLRRVGIVLLRRKTNIKSIVGLLGGFIGYFCVSCSHMVGTPPDKKNAEVERMQPVVTTFYDSLYTSFPGNIVVTDDYLVWTEPMSAENFLHIIDKQSRKEIKALGNLGNGPHDFTTPCIDKGGEDELMVYDLHKNLKLTIHPDSLQSDDSIGISFGKLYSVKGNILRRLKLTDEHDLFFIPDAPSPFGISQGKQIYYSGKHPIENSKISQRSRFNRFQGAVVYNMARGLLLYSTFSFRYMALYKKEGVTLRLVKETTPPEYSVHDGNIKFEEKGNVGVSEIALTKNYIATAEYLDKDVSHKDMRRQSYVLPRYICLYDYTMQLKKILNVDKPIMRISGNSDSDTIYAIVENPDYTIVEISVSEEFMQ